MNRQHIRGQSRPSGARQYAPRSQRESAGRRNAARVNLTRTRRSPAGVLAIALIVAAALGNAASARASAARELLDESARRNGIATWRDRTLAATIESRSGDSVARTREAKIAESNDPDGGHRTFIEFTSPSDVEGMLYLHLKPHGGEEQEWLYAPQARRSRRLTPGQSDETSSGAELGYREVESVTQLLSLREPDADASLVGDETLDGRVCRVVRYIPRSPQAGADGWDIWLGADDLLVYKLVPRAGGRAPKEILLSHYETIAGHATPRVVDVTGPDAAWRTVFKLRDVRYDVGLGDGTFSLSRLNAGH